MTPDPLDRLARFTPAPGPDAADLMFRMGRASAPTRPAWKLAVLGLVLTNAAALAWVAVRPLPVAPAPDVVTVIVPVPVPVPVMEAPVPYPPRESGGFGVLNVRDDPDRWPVPEPLAGTADPGPPLTPLAARRGELD